MNSESFAIVHSDLMHRLKNSASRLEKLKNRSVCVTGGGGFIGTWLAETIHFLNSEFSFSTQLTLLDRNFELIDARAPHLRKSEGIRFEMADVRSLIELPRDANYVVHAAASPSSREHASKPVDVMTSIAAGTERVLRACERLSDLLMCLNFSSGLVRGSEDQDLGEQFSVSDTYVEAKRYAEILGNAFRLQERVPVATVRPFSFYGPYQSLQGPWALNNFISDAIGGHSIKVLGDGKAIRSYLYGSDAALGLLLFLLEGIELYFAEL